MGMFHLINLSVHLSHLQYVILCVTALPTASTGTTVLYCNTLPSDPQSSVSTSVLLLLKQMHTVVLLTFTQVLYTDISINSQL